MTSLKQFAEELTEKMQNTAVQRTHVGAKPLGARTKRWIRRGGPPEPSAQRPPLLSHQAPLVDAFHLDV